MRLASTTARIAPLFGVFLLLAGVPAYSQKKYTPEENNKIAEKFFDTAWNKGDFDSVQNLLSPKVIDHSPVPGGKSGPDEFKAIVGMFRAAMPKDIKMTIEDMVYAKNEIAHRWMVAGTHTGAPLFGVPATGKHITLTGISIVRLENGQFAERWTELDLLGLMRQLGLAPPAPPAPGGPASETPAASWTPGKNLTPAANNAMAAKFFQTAWAGNFDAVKSILAPNVVDHSPVPGKAEGPAKFKMIIGMFRGSMPDLKMTIDDEIYMKDRVLHRWSIVGTHTGAPLFFPTVQGAAINTFQGAVTGAN